MSSTSHEGGPLAVYLTARAKHEAFLRDVLDPACREAKKAGQGVGAKIFQLEDHGNDLCAARQDALRGYVLVPAATADNLRLKLRFAYEEVLQHDDGEGLIQAIFSDVRQLLG